MSGREQSPRGELAAIAGSLAATLRRQRSLSLRGCERETAEELAAAIATLTDAGVEDPASRRTRRRPPAGAQPGVAPAPPPARSAPASNPWADEARRSERPAAATPPAAATSNPWADEAKESARSAPKPHVRSGAPPPAAPAGGAGAARVGRDAGAASEALVSARAELGDCTRCQLHASRTNIVFGVGSPVARLFFVGEAPGADEDEQGEPFVGAAGQLLTRMIGAMGLQRGDVYIGNVLKCRPPGNRRPEPNEVVNCVPFLHRQILAVRPEVIVTLGNTAVQALLQTTEGVGKLRSRWHEWRGIPLMPTYHPSYLLRQPSAKKEVWADLQLVMAKLGLPLPLPASE